MCLLVEVLLVEVLLVGVLPLVVLLALEEEMALVVSGLLEKKEKIPPGLEKPGEEEALLLFGVLLVPWCFWHLFSSVGWTGGHRHLCFWSLPMRRFADIEKIYEYKCGRCKIRIIMNEKF